MKAFGLVACALTLVLSSVASTLVFAQDGDDKNGGPQVIPFVFVGTASDCAPAPAGSNIVTAVWLTGMGLPDNGSSNIAASNRDPHFGLLLSKNGLTADCSAAGASVTRVEGTVPTEFGFDYRNGTHCGAGAPRFNLVTSDNVLHFVGGCGNGTKTPAPQDPAEWTRVLFDPANPGQAFPPVAPGTTIKSLSIIYDEGTDTAGIEDPRGVGLSVLDNIDVNGQIIPRGPQGNGKNDNNDNHDN
jgi:hypothetical protein